MTTPDNGQHFAARTKVAKKNLSFFREAGRGKALVQINNAVKFHPGIILLVGEEGSGRSRVLKQFADGLKNKPGNVCILDRVIKNENQLYAAIADGFALDLVPGENLTTTQKTVFAFLEANVDKNQPVIIALDNTHQCSLAALEALIELHTRLTSISLILVGDNGLQKMLQRLQGGKLTTSLVLLAPLDVREIHQYMNWRMPFQISDAELAHIVRVSRGNIGLLEQEALKTETYYRQKNAQHTDSNLLTGVKFSRNTVVVLLMLMTIAGGAGLVYYFYPDRAPQLADLLAFIPGIEQKPIETIQATGNNVADVAEVFRSNQEWVDQQVTLLTGDTYQ